MVVEVALYYNKEIGNDIIFYEKIFIFSYS